LHDNVWCADDKVKRASACIDDGDICGDSKLTLHYKLSDQGGDNLYGSNNDADDSDDKKINDKVRDNNEDNDYGSDEDNDEEESEDKVQQKRVRRRRLQRVWERN
jgi:hypothetical protein